VAVPWKPCGRATRAPLLRAVGEAQYPPAEPRVLVRDHLNPHQPAARYEAFAPAEARRLLARREMHETPPPGSWLAMAETALRVLAPPCLPRRMPDPTTLSQEVAAWAPQRHDAPGRLAGRFTTPAARITLKRLYPSIQLG